MDVKISNPNEGEITMPKGTVMGTFENIESHIKVVQNQESPDNEDRLREILKHLDIGQNSELTDTQVIGVDSLIENYQDIFALNRYELTTTNLIEHKIDTTTDKPVQVKYRRIPIHLLKACETEVAQLLEMGIIEPSESDYSSPAIILKRNDKVRLIVDFRELNKISKRSYAAIPSLDVITANWGGV